MRIGYSDEEDFPGQWGLFAGNCDRSLAGKRGQSALRELEAALLAMPVKRLEREVFVEATGAVCALGALAVHRKQQDGLSRDEAIAVCADMDPVESQAHGEAMGLPSPVAWKVVEQNDLYNDFTYVKAEGPSQYPYGYHGGGISIQVEVAPEERYAAMLAWVRSNIKRNDEA